MIKITKATLLNTEISRIKEVFNTGSNKRFLEITFLNKRKGDYDQVYLVLKEGLKDKGIKTYADTLKFIELNYNNNLDLKGGLK